MYVIFFNLKCALKNVNKELQTTEGWTDRYHRGGQSLCVVDD